MFDAVEYFTKMTEQNKLCSAYDFKPVVVSGPDDMEGLLEHYREDSRFVCISDTNTENLTSDDGTYGFTKRRAFTVLILSAYDYQDMDMFQREMGLCREIFRQFTSKILRDKYTYQEQFIQFETQEIPSQEFGRYQISGMTGLYFVLYTKEPVSLEYNKDEWSE